MWKLYSRCPYCKREVEVVPSILREGQYKYELHYNLVKGICEGSSKVYEPKQRDNNLRAEHDKTP